MNKRFFNTTPATYHMMTVFFWVHAVRKGKASDPTARKTYLPEITFHSVWEESSSESNMRNTGTNNTDAPYLDITN